MYSYYGYDKMCALAMRPKWQEVDTMKETREEGGTPKENTEKIAPLFLWKFTKQNMRKMGKEYAF